MNFIFLFYYLYRRFYQVWKSKLVPCLFHYILEWGRYIIIARIHGSTPLNPWPWCCRTDSKNLGWYLETTTTMFYFVNTPRSKLWKHLWGCDAMIMSRPLCTVQCWMLELNVYLYSFWKVLNQELSVYRIPCNCSLFSSNTLEATVLSLWIWHVYLLSYQRKT